MAALTWWMRVVGALYVFLFVACVILKIPIEAEGPPGVLANAAAGDPTARFVVDTWVTLGLYLGTIGVALLVASRTPARAQVLVWTVIALEAAGIVVDIYKISRGVPVQVSGTWVAIHSAIIVTGVLALKQKRPVSP